MKKNSVPLKEVLIPQDESTHCADRDNKAARRDHDAKNADVACVRECQDCTIHYR
jgi:hypothetical protein